MSEENITYETAQEILDAIKDAMENVKAKNPLTHCITNIVTTNDCANAALAVGASPIMADDEEEIAEIVDMADVLVINIGKLSKEQIKAMKAGAEHANKTGTPIAIDPVGAGISRLRNDLIKDLVLNYDVKSIRGNMSEIKAIANLIELDILQDSKSQSGKGVDVAADDIISKETLKKNGIIVKELAKELNTTVGASGPIDIISDGNKTFAIENGDEIMPCITGSGCMLTTIIGSYVGANDGLLGTVSASLLMAIAGEKAAAKVRENDLGTGSFRTFLIDYLYNLTAEDLIENANLYEIDI